MQGGFSMAVSDSASGGPITALAREHFGALTALRAYTSPGQALADVSNGVASVAVLPYPSDSDAWWVTLLHHEPRLHIIARLPFWKPRPDGSSGTQALVVASTPPECDSDVSRARLSSELTAAGLKPETMVLVRQQGAPIAHVLVEVHGYLTDDDSRLGTLGSVLRRPIVLGSYAGQIGGAAR